MSHVLARIAGVPRQKIAEILERDAPEHAREGLHLEHLWQNADHPGDVWFLFRADDLDRARDFIERVHREAQQEDPDANLPAMTYLRGG